MLQFCILTIEFKCIPFTWPSHKLCAKKNHMHTVGHLFLRTAIFMDFMNYLFYTKIVSPKYNIYARINHNRISGGHAENGYPLK